MVEKEAICSSKLRLLTLYQTNTSACTPQTSGRIITCLSGSFALTKADKKVWKEILCPGRCWARAFLLGGGNRCRMENWCFRNRAVGVDFTSSIHRASPVAPPFGLRGHIQSWVKLAHWPKWSAVSFGLFSFKTISYQIHSTFSSSSTCIASECEVHDFPRQSLALEYFKYICWNRTVIIRD